MLGKRVVLAVALVVVVVAIAGCLFCRTRHIQDLYQRLTLRISICTAGVAMVGGVLALLKWSDEIEERTQKNRFERLSLLQDRLNSRDFRKKQKNIVQYWGKFLGDLERIRDGLEFPARAETKEDFERELGIRINIPEAVSDEALRLETEEVCNEFEYIGGLLQAKVISCNEIEIFFQTMPGDTFVRLLPFILFKRQKKSTYARHFQELARSAGRLSADVG